MDRKGVIILIVSFGLLMLWIPLVNRLYPPIPVPQSTNQLSQITGTNQPPGTNGPGPALTAETSPPVASGSEVIPPLAPSAPEKTEFLENADTRILLTSHGGGIKLVELKKHHETISRKRDPNSTNDLVTLNTKASAPVLALLGGVSLQGDGEFQLSRTPQSVQAEKSLTNGLHLIKEFRLGSNYLIHARIKLENRSDQPLVLPEQHWIAGTATPINPHDKGMYVGVYWYDGQHALPVNHGWFANRFLGCFPGTPRTVYQEGTSNVVWAACHNQFFTLATIPDRPADRIIVLQTNLPPPTRETIHEDSKVVTQPLGYQASLVYPAATLAPHASLEKDFEIYAGPKEYNTLARIGARMKNNLDLIMGYSGFFGFFAKALLLSMNFLHNVLLFPYGLAIITITVVIKTLFWPLTSASTKSMKRMAALQPQMKALQERYKEDPVKMNRKLMEFMKEHKVSPLGGCLPMLLQIPVFFGFYRMILSATELRGAAFLWANDLSKPDTLFIIPGTSIPFNLLPLIMGATMLWQARLTPPSPGMDPMQQKMMRYMPLMFLFILYNFSAGLTLYWTVQNLLTIAQTKLTRAKDETAATSTAKPAPRPAAPVKPKKKR
jgi:YidC/Oxa1 family membrane protein insertase